MKIITCAGYYRTGSSAVSDFFREFDNCESLGDTEFRFVQDPDGVSDLEYNLVENPHRHNSSHAIKRFLKLSKFNNGNCIFKRYSKFFGKKYAELTHEYVNSLTRLKCKNWWHFDQIEKGGVAYFVDRVFSKMCQIKSKYRSNLTLSCRNEQAYYTDISKDEFLEKTVTYTSKLFENVANGKEFVVADQLVPPTNTDRYVRYFKDIKIIVVDRDPRDLFFIENRFYRWGIIPHRNVVDFCNWYKITRNQMKSNISGKALFIRFEDFVFDYEKCSKQIMEFVGIDESHHLRIKQFFDPEVSKKSIGLYKIDRSMKNAIEYIEKELKDYCYDAGQ